MNLAHVPLGLFTQPHEVEPDRPLQHAGPVVVFDNHGERLVTMDYCRHERRSGVQNQGGEGALARRKDRVCSDPLRTPLLLPEPDRAYEGKPGPDVTERYGDPIRINLDGCVATA